MSTKPQFPAEVNTSTDCAQAIHNLRTEEWLLDQTYFPLQPGAWGHFQAALDNPAPASPALVELLNQRPPWEKPDISSNPQMTDLSAGRRVAIFGQEIAKNPCGSKKNTPGGPTIFENLRTLCKYCNSSKGAKNVRPVA